MTNTEGKPIEARTSDGVVIVDPKMPSGGKSNWTIGEVRTAANTEVKVPVTVTDDEGTAGFVAKYTYDDKLTFKKKPAHFNGDSSSEEQLLIILFIAAFPKSFVR